MAKTYPHLFKPIRIGNLIVPKYAATQDSLNGHEGFVTDAGGEYMRQRVAVNPIDGERKR